MEHEKKDADGEALWMWELKRAVGASPHLVPSLVREIRAKLAAGARQSEVAAEYCVSRQCIHYIAKGKTWRQVI